MYKQPCRRKGKTDLGVERSKLGLRGTLAHAPEKAFLGVGTRGLVGPLLLGHLIRPITQKVSANFTCGQRNRDDTSPSVLTSSIRWRHSGSWPQRADSVNSGVVPTW